LSHEIVAEGQDHEHVALPGLAHHFDSYEQQKESASLGMWLFLAQEVLFFGVLFTAYAIFRWNYQDAFQAASHHLNAGLGLFNTGVLILSSLTMALAVRSSQLGRKVQLLGFLLATFALGAVFLGVKAYEYHHKWEEGFIPGLDFHFDGPHAKHAQMFFILYFCMTGLHALHMIVGMGILLWMVIPTLEGKFTPENHNFVEGMGLYWHFVDIVWIFLFPLLYLIGRHGPH